MEKGEFSLCELEENCEKFKRKMNSLGEVNLVAIEEFEELNTRFEFLTTHKEDLLLSKDSLKKAISKINRTSKEVFLDVFAKVSEEFKKNFKFLFGGGRAQLDPRTAACLLHGSLSFLIQVAPRDGLVDDAP